MNSILIFMFGTVHIAFNIASNGVLVKVYKLFRFHTCCNYTVDYIHHMLK